MSVSQGCLVFVGFVSLLCLVSIELLGSWIPNRVKYFWRVFTQLSFPVFFFFFFFWTTEREGKVAQGSLQMRFSVERDWLVFGSCVGSCCLSKTGGAEVIATSCLL